MRKPRAWVLTRIALAIAPALSWGLEASDRIMPELLQGMPWSKLTLVLVIFALGFFAADFMNPKSDLRQWLRWKFRVCDVELSLPSPVTPDAEWVAPTANLRFVRNVRNVRIAYFGIPNVQLKRSFPPILINTIPPRDYLARETVNIALATIFIKQRKSPPSHSYWGSKTEDDASPRHLLVGESENVAEIKLMGRRTLQVFRVFFAVLEPTGGRDHVFAVPEDRDIFERAT